MYTHVHMCMWYDVCMPVHVCTAMHWCACVFLGQRWMLVVPLTEYGAH